MTGGLINIAIRLNKQARTGSKRLLLAICATMALTSPAEAAGSTTGLVSELLVYNDGHNTVFIRLSTPPAGTRPACATTASYAGALNVGTPAGQAQYAMLLSAQSANENVLIIGADTCTYSSTTEDVKAVYFPE